MTSTNSSLAIGRVIAQCRREAGITQEALAAHLGVTKAAVSKWELEQNLPDIVLLPRIAAFFGISTDKLLGYSEQTGDEERTRITNELLATLIADFDEGFDACKQTERSHWRDWPLLVIMASFLISRALYRPDRYDEAMAYVESLLCRIEDECGDAATARNVRIMRASILIDPARGRVDECIALLEPFVSHSAEINAPSLLASAYDNAGRAEDALKLRQKTVFFSAMTAINDLLAQITSYRDKPEHLTAIADGALAMLSALRFDAINPPLGLSALAQAAVAYRNAGQTERALCALEDFRRAFDAMARDGLYSAPRARDAVLFDAIADEMAIAGDSSSAQMMEAMNADAVLDGAIASILAGADWGDCACDERFAALMSRRGNAASMVDYWLERR